MFENKLNTITLSGEVYPMKCSILVLEKIQDKYGTLEEFEDRLSIFEENPKEDTWDEETEENTDEETEGKLKIKVRFPNMTAVCDALFWFVQEGEEIAAEEEGRKPVKYKRESLARKMDLSLFEAAQILRKEFSQSFASKNQKTTKTEDTGKSR